MEKEINRQMRLLNSKNNREVCQALKTLEKISNQTNSIYPYMSSFIQMIDHPNSYVRNRGLLLIAANAKWDVESSVDEIIDSYLEHITDEKPITARQCIKALPLLAKYKPALESEIINALRTADISSYPDSMQSLIYKDIQTALLELQSKKN